MSEPKKEARNESSLLIHWIDSSVKLEGPILNWTAAIVEVEVDHEFNV